MRQNRGLYIAAAVFLLAAAIYFFADKNGRPPVVTPSPQPSPVVGLGASQVQQVVIHARGKVLTLARQGTAWTYSVCPDGQSDCPVNPADQSLSLQYIQALTELRPVHVVYGAPEGLPAYGVDKPTGGELDIRSTSGRQVTVLVGGKSTDGASYFLRRQDSQNILTVATTTVDGQLLALVDRPPVPAPSPAPAPSTSP
ncbi:MAG: DUF4340 domain-containing protein [Candidatus Dormibacteria bacterium]